MNNAAGQAYESYLTTYKLATQQPTHHQSSFKYNTPTKTCEKAQELSHHKAQQQCIRTPPDSKVFAKSQQPKHCVKLISRMHLCSPDIFL
jgi:hypothetical protein